MSKGSTRRPTELTEAEVAQRWAMAFGNLSGKIPQLRTKTQKQPRPLRKTTQPATFDPERKTN